MLKDSKGLMKNNVKKDENRPPKEIVIPPLKIKTNVKVGSSPPDHGNDPSNR